MRSQISAEVKYDSSPKLFHSDVANLKDIVRALRLDKKKPSFCSSSSPHLSKPVELSCVTCGANSTKVWDTPMVTQSNLEKELKRVSLPKRCCISRTPIPTSSVVKPIPEVTKDQVHPSCSQSTAPVQPPVGPEPITTPVLEPIVAPVVAPVPNTKPSVSLPYPSRRDNEKSRNQANEQIEKFYEIFKER
ncbi:hypothetical protein Tco_0908032 [Tanacetum coccineum]|uniref:Uncharacterized protein n=1 Tax=Tanacetum coccineum TaxID=301880 RepID=A0ABQ5CN38_9ASTR